MGLPVSQVQVVGEPPHQTWDDYERGCMLTYRGGHHEPAECRAFVHGMQTVFTLLRHEFPPAQLCKQAPKLKAAVLRLKSVIDGLGDHMSL